MKPGFFSGIGEWAAKNLFGSFVEGEVSSRVMRESKEWLSTEDSNWRSLSQTPRDLSPVSHDKHLQLAHYLAETNPFARQVLNLYRDFIVGDGISYEIKHEDSDLQDEIRKTCEEFWNAPVHDLDLNTDTWVWELFRDGELILPVAVNSANGQCELGYIDPRNVKEVRIDPENPLITDAVVVKSSATQSERVFKVVRIGKDGLYEIPKGGDGACFYFAINRPTNATRGKSETYACADWFAALDRSLFNEIERRELLKAFIWWAKITGASPETIQAYQKEMQKKPLRQGTVKVTSDAVEWKAVTPDLKGQDSVEFTRFLKQFVGAGAGFPPHYLGDPDNTNRATALAMTDPVNRQIKTKGRVIKKAWHTLLTFALHMRIRAGYFGSKTEAAKETKIEVKLFEPGRKDSETIITGAKALAEANMVAVQNKWIDNEDAATMYAGQVSQLGTEVLPLHQKEPKDQGAYDLEGDEEEEIPAGKSKNGKAKLKNYEARINRALAS